MQLPIIKRRGLQPYVAMWDEMRAFTLERNADSPDEIWIVEHPPVFTQGKAGKPEHIRVKQDNIPIVWSDRGGQITYHAPGQIIIYVLLNLHRLQLGVRSLVTCLENAVINTLAEFSIDAHNAKAAPGVYVNHAKIAAIGLRVRNGFTYHGLAFNFKMDLTPFSYINPCGYETMGVTQLYDLLHNKAPTQAALEDNIVNSLLQQLGYISCDK